LVDATRRKNEREEGSEVSRVSAAMEGFLYVSEGEDLDVRSAGRTTPSSFPRSGG
jgi:hypothetical protein